MKKNIYILSFVFCLFSCKESKTDYKKISAKSSKGYYQAVIEIPSGTNKKYEYNYESKTFEIDQKNGKDRIIEFLPYVGNYGFIASTLSDKEKGGDGDAVDVLVLSESYNVGDVVEVIPISMLKLIDENEEDYKVIAIPANSKENILKISSIEELKEKHPAVLEIIELWFSNYDSDDLGIRGWADKSETEKYLSDNLK